VIWLTWRQHRIQFLSALAVLVVLVGVTYVSRTQMTTFARSNGLTGCLASGRDCSTFSQDFEQHFTGTLNSVIFLNLLPLLVGFFWGAPLLAHELEHNTHRVAWTQTVSTARWLTVKLATIIGATVLAAGAMALMMSWWFQPFQQAAATSRISPDAFGLVGIVPIGYALFALALGVAAGVVVGRVVPAMGVTLVGFTLVRLSVSKLRSHFVPTMKAVYPVGGSGGRVGGKSWVISSGYTDGLGHHYSLGAADRLCRSDAADYQATIRCLRGHGLQRTDIYHPDRQFWPLQGIETSIFIILAIALIAFATYWTLRQIK
jgi:hypothetical protein